MLGMERVNYIILALLHVGSASKSFTVSEVSRIEVVGNYSALKSEKNRVLLGHMKLVTNFSSTHRSLLELYMENGGTVNCSLRTLLPKTSSHAYNSHEIIFQLVDTDFICSVDQQDPPNGISLSAPPSVSLLLEIKFAPTAKAFSGCVTDFEVLGAPVLCSSKSSTPKLHVRHANSTNIQIVDQNIFCSKSCFSGEENSTHLIAALPAEKTKSVNEASESSVPKPPEFITVQPPSVGPGSSSNKDNYSNATEVADDLNSTLSLINDLSRTMVLSNEATVEANSSHFVTTPSQIPVAPARDSDAANAFSNLTVQQTINSVPTTTQATTIGTVTYTTIVNSTLSATQREQTTSTQLLTTSTANNSPETTLLTAATTQLTHNFCTGIVCQNGANCVAKPDRGECNCSSQWIGPDCSILRQSLQTCTVQCQNGGSCNNETGNCSCHSGYEGDYCENVSGGSSNTAEIVGGVLGSLAFVALLIGGTFLFRYVRKSRQLRGKYNPAKEEVLAGGQATTLPMMPITKEERLI